LKNNDNNSLNNNFTKESLDEAIVTTIYRDLYSVYIKLILVINPLISDEVKKKHIRQWDLWGPLFYTLLLSFFLSKSKDSNEMSKTFVLVFVLMWVGGVVITINTILLGAHM
jgi:hypothetical protein